MFQRFRGDSYWGFLCSIEISDFKWAQNLPSYPILSNIPWIPIPAPLPDNAPRASASPAFFQVRLTEVQQLLQFPLLLSIDFDRWSPYNFYRKEVVPFLYVGASYHLLLASSYPEISRESGVGRFLSSSSFDDIARQRHRSNLSLLAGGGFKFKIGRSYLSLDVRYNRWLQNMVDADNRYTNTELVYRYGQIDSDLTFDSFSSFIGFEIPFYRPTRRQ